MRKIHKEVLSIADEVIRAFDKHHLQYYPAEGTLLGAIRHKGMIPWDDDIDIVMPRDDYDKAVLCLDAELPEPYKVVTYKRRKTHLRYFIQVESSKIKVVEEGHNQPLVRNVWIDIFPLDGVPDGFIRRRAYVLGLLYRRMRVQLSQFDEIVDQRKKNRPLHEKAIMGTARMFKIGRKKSPMEMMDKLDAFLHKYDYGTSKWCINPLSAYKARAIMPKDYFGKGYFSVFEGRNWRLPDQPDRILRQLYGDYMKPPPESDRANHHIRIIE